MRATEAYTWPLTALVAGIAVGAAAAGAISDAASWQAAVLAAAAAAAVGAAVSAGRRATLNTPAAAREAGRGLTGAGPASRVTL